MVHVHVGKRRKEQIRGVGVLSYNRVQEYHKELFDISLRILTRKIRETIRELKNGKIKGPVNELITDVEEQL